MEAQKATPAITPYWSGKVYRDLLATIKDSHVLNVASAKKFWDGARSNANIISRIFNAVRALAVVLFGPVVWLLLIPLHVLVVVSIAPCVMIGYVCATIAEKCYVAFHGWTVVCRHCGDKIKHLEYQCSSCSRWHPKLFPSSFGISHHRCRCGQMLPCTGFGDRHLLRARCPYEGCHKDLNASVETRSATSVVCIIGPPSSGKTGFMIAAMQAMSRYIAPRFFLKGSFSDAASEKFFREEKKYITQTGSTRKTTNEHPPAFNALFQSANGKFRQQLYFFDAAGEIFLTSDRLAGHHHFKHVTGGVIIVDPFSLPVLKERYRENLKALNLDTRITQEDLMDVVERFIIGMQRHFGLAADRAIKAPFAVIVTKTDLGKLHKKLVPAAIADDPIALSHHIRQTIEKWGATGLTHFLDTKFENVEYFAASPIALRRSKDGDTAQLRSGDLVMPLMWLFETARDPLVKVGR